MQKEIPAILANLKIDALNEMQQASLEANRTHNDVILLSATGSGKTLAFLLPVLERLEPGKKSTQALIVVPSRELALQIEKVFRQMGTGYKITACYGGHLRETEENNLIEAPAVIVGTPGRLGDHIRRENITVNTIETLVLDEFDKTLELGFQEEVSFIVSSLPNINRHQLTSATEAVEIPEFIALKDPAKLNFLPEEGGTPERLAIKQVLSPENDKLETLFRLICHLGNRSTIVFCNHREAVERTSAYLSEKGILNTFYHGAMEQQERDSALCKFRNGTTNVLVTTDLAARGLDIPHIRYIVHYHLPHTEDSFTHRNGRTARMDASGTAILILSPEEKLMPYITDEVETIELPEKAVLPEKPKWVTLFIAAGKKDKVNKIDIVGFLGNKAKLKKEDIGLIEVKDFFSFVAVVRSKAGQILEMIKNEKIKNKKVKIDIAR
ncbi:DEAD/DEAH box helicase [Chitinophaga sp. Cy-1792]|uniref:DEAD/DEAH box helicase n=1 Tax=Chitinophaga sp. Cy-1792 TaxID=2608339 RepID=UPI00141EC3C1|nr:DEAD/DEAH box helicase [Chitinophaga sp. Cy-1792]NIG54171.1 DEAD/DEAH box helicase [Chitinophaga sp. Cy-1792]